MRFFRARCEFASWIAVLAILLASLAPTLSHALNLGKPVSWVEICSAQGSKWVQGNADESGGSPAGVHLLKHCAYCSIHVPLLGPPAAPEVFALPFALKLEFPLAFLDAPLTLHAWLSAKPRGPPLIA